MENQEWKTRYTVFSEGYSFWSVETGREYYGGNLELVEVNQLVEVDEDGDEFVVEENTTDWLDRTFLDDKWGGKEIIELPEDLDCEFGNGLIHHGAWDSYDEAKEAYDNLITGEVKWDDIAQYN